LVRAGVVSATGIFSPDAAKVGSRLAMSPGAVWWGSFLFRDNLEGTGRPISAATPLRWAADPQPTTSSEGGGLWGFSRHIKGTELANVLTFARFVAADPRWQVDLSVGLPGVGPLQQPWPRQAAQCRIPGRVRHGRHRLCVRHHDRAPPTRDYTRYNTGTVWTYTVTPRARLRTLLRHRVGHVSRSGWSARRASFGYTIRSSG